MWVIKLYHFNCNWKKKEGRTDKEGEGKGWKWKRRKGEGREEEGREGEDNSPVSSKLKSCWSSYDFCWTVEICTLYVLFFYGAPCSLFLWFGAHSLQRWHVGNSSQIDCRCRARPMECLQAAYAPTRLYFWSALRTAKPRLLRQISLMAVGQFLFAHF